ncbi:helix-turn-helix transcriptional regulator [Alloyangia pacifica]|uniref:HTH domain-containing protein n=1 Tax=Alloyangia pacifica TaxID=311180 RepID=A0A1I6PAC9_9RHOB|nr:HTH domain-containing protein [Alloyangia pacifica]SDG23185.1 HTH domain-containing protein [Alloyangia pacifica]SFS37136.1 HTH domain-containing protein [Alloyangia pacifica]
MKKSDRLANLMLRLKDGSLHTAEAMASELGVSVRTIYRDMDTLAASGVPIEGERGRGYTARAAFTLPPLNLSELELEALHLGLAAVGQGGMADLAEAAEALSARIDALLPEDGTTGGAFGFATYPFREVAEGFRFMPDFRAAIRARQKLRVTLKDRAAPQDLRPLHMDYWGRIWTCITWNETARGFETIRIEQVTGVTPLPGLFVDEPGKSLADFRAAKG